MIERVPPVLASLFLALACTGCRYAAGLTASETQQVAAGDRVVVLLRVECEIDGQPCEPFGDPGFLGDELFVFGLGSFESVGEPSLVFPRFLEGDSERGGWMYLLLAPGTYYFTVLGPGNGSSPNAPPGGLQPLRRSPRWRMDVPEGSPIIHPGTLSFEGTTAGTLLFGARIVIPTPDAPIAIRDEADDAALVAARHFPPTNRVPFVPLRRWHPGDPKVITTPYERKHAVRRPTGLGETP